MTDIDQILADVERALGAVETAPLRVYVKLLDAGLTPEHAWSAAQAAQDRPRRDETPSAGGADGQDAPDAPTGHTRDQAHQAAHHAQTQGGQAGIASGLAAIAYAILARGKPATPEGESA